ncbi:MAG TPA: hypothetical protein VNM41_05995 [Solirubrobacterales bacterium]|nr:hypothetical protein [Solirubrobacterales bacterium]
MDGKVGVGETLRETFAIYRDQAGVLLPVAFWLFLVVAIAELLAADNELLIFLISTVIGLTVTFLYEGMVVALVRDVREGRRAHSVGDLMRSVMPVLGRLVGAGLLVVTASTLALLLLVAPGLYLFAIWAVAAPVIVIERLGVTDSLGRSRQLVRGNGWPVLGVIVLAFLIGAVVALGLGLGAEAIVEGDIVETVFGTLAATVTAPIEALVASVLYFRLLEIERAGSVLQ